MQFSTTLATAILALSATALPSPAAIPAEFNVRSDSTNSTTEVAQRCCYPSIIVCYWDMCLDDTTGFGTDACLGACEILCKGKPEKNANDPTVEQVRNRAWNC